MIDTKIKIYLSSGLVINEQCNYNALLVNLNSDIGEYLISPNYIIPKINIEHIEMKKIENKMEEI